MPWFLVFYLSFIEKKDLNIKASLLPVIEDLPCPGPLGPNTAPRLNIAQRSDYCQFMLSRGLIGHLNIFPALPDHSWFSCSDAELTCQCKTMNWSVSLCSMCKHPDELCVCARVCACTCVHERSNEAQFSLPLNTSVSTPHPLSGPFQQGYFCISCLRSCCISLSCVLHSSPFPMFFVSSSFVCSLSSFCIILFSSSPHPFNTK